MPHPLPAPATQGTKWSVHRAVRQGVVPATVLVVVLGVCLAASVPLEWLGQLIRTGAELAIAALNSWGDGLTSLMIAEPAPLGSLTLRGVQVLALLGILGTIPAALDLVRAIRTRAGARSIIGSTLLLIVLGGIAWATLSFHVLTPGTGS